MLLVAGGRLGDSILGAAFVARLRQWFGAPVHAVGRTEAGAVLAPLVDRFTAMSPEALAGDAAALRAARAELAGSYRLVLTDPHVFQGGEALCALVDAVAAPRKFHCAGHLDPDPAAAQRARPRTATAVPALAKPKGSTDPQAVHLWHDLRNYYGSVLAAVGAADRELPSAPLLPAAALDAGANARFGLPVGSFLACQPSSSQGKKDWPAAAFAQLLAAHPDRRVVWLGSAADAARAPAPAGVADLRGRTSLREAMQLAASCRAFVGVDSGLAHAAAVAGRPTVVAMAAATRGRFMPYPQELGRPLLHAVSHRDYADCAGCLGLCAHAPIWRTHRQGLPCVRELPVAAMATALDAAWAAGADYCQSSSSSSSS